MTTSKQTSDAAELRGIALAIRSIIGGMLMGLANLVPGISGGTMLLASGIYPQFISGVAEVTTFRFRLRTIILLALVVAAAVGAIVGFASLISTMVIDHRWIMYSLFIGLTLGGVPLLWRMVKPANPTVILCALLGMCFMAVLAFVQPGESGEGERGMVMYLMLVLAGAAGGAAMILPGLSGAYLLLILGQYLTILAAIDTARQAASAQDMAMLTEAMHVFIPVGVGVVLGVVGLSNLMKLLLDKAEKPTLGVLLGLLLGAVFGLWPFQEPVQPEVGDVVKGVELTRPEMIGQIAVEDWPTTFFTPTPLQIAIALGCIAAGFAVSALIARLGNGR